MALLMIHLQKLVFIMSPLIDNKQPKNVYFCQIEA